MYPKITVAEVKALYEASGKAWDDNRLYDLFYPDKFKYKIRYAIVDYSYVHKKLKKTGVALKLLWEEYSDKCIAESVKYKVILKYGSEIYFSEKICHSYIYL